MSLHIDIIFRFPKYSLGAKDAIGGSLTKTCVVFDH